MNGLKKVLQKASCKMKHFSIIGIISAIKIRVDMNTFLIYLFIHPLIMESDATMPAFIGTFINPFVNLLSYVGFPVQKHDYFDAEIMADVRQVNEFETPAKVEEIVDASVNSNYNRNEQFECGPEIPILLLNNGKQSLIMRSTDGSNVIQWNQYKKVSEMRIKTKYGVDESLAEFLAQVSQMKESNTPKRYRPMPPTMVQGSWNETITQPIANKQINRETSKTAQSTCNQCDDDAETDVKNRPHFPISTPTFYQF
ncbi:uncharacterized protein LOC116343066 [Contarinia nasturtii]|uniref:uncharacterized protein LOC116343066 n=1 Tax=Contarinia nasturtii TaxID=265458 RepID=UPI0012D3746C|nr:uncharacterized protein LOC116343066 [Contarinia nasturtii]